MIQEMQLITKNDASASLSNPKGRSHIAKRRAAVDIVMQNVCDMLSWGELYYCNIKYQTGLAYLRLQTTPPRPSPKGREICGNDQDAFAYLERSKMFWGWWKNEWLMRDEAFELGAGRLKNVGFRREVYRQINKPEHLILSLEYSWAQAIEFINLEMIKA